ncbi:MAG TPA: 3-dehydroquinate synthase [Lactobacillaceae bacterium]|jgi:3-dehydroquinate synthase
MQIDLPEKTYQVVIENDVQKCLGAVIAEQWSPRKIALITDAQVADFYLASVQEQLVAAGFTVLPLVVPVGETSKSLAVVEKLASQMAEFGMTRRDGVIGLGGGVVGDLAGVVASLYMRGVALIHIATSLTAQVDSSVGGKTAVNLATVKNVLGTFYQPDLVVVDPTFLATLTTRDLVEGYAEVVKMSALAGADFWALTGKIQTPADILTYAKALIEASVAYKASVVMADEKEANRRQVLNFGHTFGHAIELLAHGKLRHGEAIAIGMIDITRAFEKMGVSQSGLTQALSQRLTAVGLPTSSDLLGTPAFYAGLQHDKKNTGQAINLIALARIGQPQIVPMAPAAIQDLREK